MLERVLDPLASHYAFQVEEGDDQHHPHIQLVVKFNEPRRISELKSLEATFPSLSPFALNLRPVHWEKVHQTARSNPHSSWLYCTKADGRLLPPRTKGDCPPSPRSTGQGARTDVSSLYDSVLSGASDRDLLRADTLGFFRFFRAVDRVRLTISPPLSCPKSCYLLIGPTDAGKSHFARYSPLGANGNPDALWISPIGQLWGDGIQPHHTHALFEEFGGARSHVSLDELLRFTDVYPFRIPIKGSYVFFTIPNLFFSTNNHPSLWYSYAGRDEQYRALKRRFTAVLRFSPRVPGSPRPVVAELRHGTHEFDAFWLDMGVNTAHVEAPTRVIDLT